MHLQVSDSLNASAKKRKKIKEDDVRRQKTEEVTVVRRDKARERATFTKVDAAHTEVDTNIGTIRQCLANNHDVSSSSSSASTLPSYTVHLNEKCAPISNLQIGNHGLIFRRTQVDSIYKLVVVTDDLTDTALNFAVYAHPENEPVLYKISTVCTEVYENEINNLAIMKSEANLITSFVDCTDLDFYGMRIIGMKDAGACLGKWENIIPSNETNRLLPQDLRDIFVLMEQMHHTMAHGDMHTQNICVLHLKTKKRFSFIDFERGMPMAEVPDDCSKDKSRLAFIDWTYLLRHFFNIQVEKVCLEDKTGKCALRHHSFLSVFFCYFQSNYMLMPDLPEKLRQLAFHALLPKIHVNDKDSAEPCAFHLEHSPAHATPFSVMYTRTWGSRRDRFKQIKDTKLLGYEGNLKHFMSGMKDRLITWGTRTNST